jgi:hypothetical protein
MNLVYVQNAIVFYHKFKPIIFANTGKRTGSISWHGLVDVSDP